MTIFLNRNKHLIISILTTYIFFILYNFILVKNISTALIDWLDYPLIVYIQQQNIEHITSLDLEGFNNAEMYHYSPNSMYFSDLLLPQSIIGLFIFPFTQNYITTHNIVFFIVGLLNILSLNYFWPIFFKDKRVIFLLTLLFTFSPYVLNMYAHYQMISYWFFFFSLGKLLQAKKPSDYLISGILSGFQFLAGVYIGIYSITISGLFFIWHLVKIRKFKKTINTGAFFLLGFLISAGYFVFKFAQVQKEYEIRRPADEYVNHSMQISDFIFNPLPSLWTEAIYKYVNSNNHRHGGETFGTGFILLGVSIFGAYKLKKSKLKKSNKFISGFLILMFLWGFMAIFGPRLTINGKYLAIPLPYIFPLKLTPFFSALRVVSRWFFVVQIGLLYFVGYSIDHVFKRYSFKKATVIIFIVLILYAIEIVPIKQRTSTEIYKSYAYNQIVTNCKTNQAVLEYPTVPEQPKTTVYLILNYWTKMLLNQMYYDCKLVNGYSGYQPKHIDDFFNSFRISIEKSDTQEIQNLIKNKKITYIKFNKNMMLPESITNITALFTTNNYKILLNNSEYLVVMVK